MYLMYVDESGDVGLVGSPTRYFILTGLVVHESRWREFINYLLDFRRRMRNIYGLPLRREIHAVEYISSNVLDIPRYNRLAILRHFIDELSKFDGISVTNIIVNKDGKKPDYEVFEKAWQALFQRFEDTLRNGNFPGGHINDHGIVITDATNGNKLVRLVRKMAVHNFIPNQPQYGPGARNLPIHRIIEDPYPKDSETTLPIQASDTIAYFLKQKYLPNAYIRRNAGQHYFDRLGPVLNVHASTRHKQGIVEL